MRPSSVSLARPLIARFPVFPSALDALGRGFHWCGFGELGWTSSRSGLRVEEISHHRVSLVYIIDSEADSLEQVHYRR